jgi:hypothetical protein
MQDFIASLNLADVRHFLLSGDPPIVVQLLALNTVLMVLFLIRRIRGKAGQPMHVTYTMQWILVFGIVGVILEDQWLPYVGSGKSLITDRYQRAVNP